ncbi:MAG: rod shape-determining protein RodA [Gammaproteobacteria bacterium]|nr:MAG: rod shape-determining protein RodA [Gammaproteobacteria bacterium]
MKNRALRKPSLALDGSSEQLELSFVEWISLRLHIDLVLFVGILILAVIGFFTLYSASGMNSDKVFHQSLRLSVALAAMLVIAQVPPRRLLQLTPVIYGIGVFLLLLVALIGSEGKGAQRWLNLGFIRFQPSELLKISVPMAVAWYLARYPLPPNFKQLCIAAGLILLPTILIAKQPDLGTSILVACSGGFVIFLAGIPWRILLGMIGLISASIPVLWMNLHDYQKSRIDTFLNPEHDPLGAGYHIIQSKIAIGSGGMMGKGWLQGSQAHLEFLPERATDFIFAVYSEEFGFVGNLLLLLAYLFVILRGMSIASQADSNFSRLLAGSLILSFFLYIIINMGMVAGLLPVVGLPLPLISYGGTSMVTIMIGFGILMSIHTHRKFIPT